MEDEINVDARPRLWRAIDDLQKENIIYKEKIRVIEESFLRHLSFHDGMAKSLDGIRDKLDENASILIRMDGKVENNKKRIDTIFAMPKTTLYLLSLLLGVTVGIYHFWHWIVKTLELR